MSDLVASQIGTRRLDRVGILVGRIPRRFPAFAAYVRRLARFCAGYRFVLHSHLTILFGFVQLEVVYAEAQFSLLMRRQISGGRTL